MGKEFKTAGPPPSSVLCHLSSVLRLLDPAQQMGAQQGEEVEDMVEIGVKAGDAAADGRGQG